MKVSKVCETMNKRNASSLRTSSDAIRESGRVKKLSGTAITFVRDIFSLLCVLLYFVLFFSSGSLLYGSMSNYTQSRKRGNSPKWIGSVSAGGLDGCWSVVWWAGRGVQMTVLWVSVRRWWLHTQNTQGVMINGKITTRIVTIMGSNEQCTSEVAADEEVMLCSTDKEAL